MKSWFVTCIFLAVLCWRSPDLGYQHLSDAACLVLLPVVVTFNTADLKRTMIQLLSSLVAMALAFVFESDHRLAYGYTAPLAVGGLFCLANAMSPPPYSLARFLIHIAYFGNFSVVYVTRHYWTPALGLAYWLGMVVALLLSSLLKPLQAPPGGRWQEIPVGSENDKQTGLFVGCLLAALLVGPLVHLAFDLPGRWLPSSWLLGSSLVAAGYVRVLLVTGLRLGPADRWGDNPGPRLLSVSQIPWNSYGLAALMVVVNFLVPYSLEEPLGLLAIHGLLLVLGFGSLFRPLLRQRTAF